MEDFVNRFEMQSGNVVKDISYIYDEDDAELALGITASVIAPDGQDYFVEYYYYTDLANIDGVPSRESRVMGLSEEQTKTMLRDVIYAADEYEQQQYVGKKMQEREEIISKLEGRLGGGEFISDFHPEFIGSHGIAVKDIENVYGLVGGLTTLSFANMVELKKDYDVSPTLIGFRATVSTMGEEFEMFYNHQTRKMLIDGVEIDDAIDIGLSRSQFMAIEKDAMAALHAASSRRIHLIVDDYNPNKETISGRITMDETTRVVGFRYSAEAGLSTIQPLSANYYPAAVRRELLDKLNKSLEFQKQLHLHPEMAVVKDNRPKVISDQELFSKMIDLLKKEGFITHNEDDKMELCYITPQNQKLSVSVNLAAEVKSDELLNKVSELVYKRTFKDWENFYKATEAPGRVPILMADIRLVHPILEDADEKLSELFYKYEIKRPPMTVLLCEPNKTARAVQIDGTLESMQDLVDGYIETIPYRGATIVCNSEGKLRNLDSNRAIKDSDGQLIDIIAGTFLIAGTSKDRFSSLSEDLMKEMMWEFVHPHKLFKVPEDDERYPLGVMAVPYKAADYPLKGGEDLIPQVKIPEKAKEYKRISYDEREL